MLRFGSNLASLEPVFSRLLAKNLGRSSACLPSVLSSSRQNSTEASDAPKPKESKFVRILRKEAPIIHVVEDTKPKPTKVGPPRLKPGEPRNEPVEKWLYKIDDRTSYDIEVTKHFTGIHKVFIWHIFKNAEGKESKISVALDSMQHAEKVFQCLKAIDKCREIWQKDENEMTIYEENFSGTAHDYNICLKRYKQRDNPSKFHRRFTIKTIEKKDQKVKSITVGFHRIDNFISIFKEILKKYGPKDSSNEVKTSRKTVEIESTSSPTQTSKKTTLSETSTQPQVDKPLKRTSEIVASKSFDNLDQNLTVELTFNGHKSKLLLRQLNFRTLNIDSLQGLQSLIGIMKDVTTKFEELKKAGLAAQIQPGTTLYETRITETFQAREKELAVKFESKSTLTKYDFYFWILSNLENPQSYRKVAIPEPNLTAICEYLEAEVMPKWKETQGSTIDARKVAIKS